ncbi:MAG: outer membrane beta-barrel protein [Flavobacteriales bacterium]|nr:outer membrane beta-barrel protein [Flavobacteriales bacterium]
MRTTSIPSLATAILICCALQAIGQEVRLGGGWSGSNVREAGDQMWTGQAGYLLGADVLLGGQWFLRSGAHLHVRNLNYTMAGTTPDGEVVGTDVEYRYTSRSLRVPAHVGLRLIDPVSDPALNIYVFGGPTALMALSADLRNDALEVETRPAQWQLGFGGGVELGFLFAEAGYDVAMTNVFKGEVFSTNPRVNNAYLTGGMRLRLAR